LNAGDEAAIAWVPWDPGAFARAASERKPVLLSITASWCRACHEMDRTTYASPSVVAIVQDGFVPIRVDTDRRPDINERYNLGGWPTTAFLTASGEILGGGTFVTSELMPGILQRVIDAVRTRAGEIQQAQAAEPMSIAATAADPPALDTLIDLIFSTFDDEHGGFGVAPKFPLTAPLHLALALYADHADAWSRHIVERTLDAMGAGGLYDRVNGGFYRYATTREWQLPHVEKLLDTNAALLRVYAEAARVLADDEYRRVASQLAAYIRRNLAGPSRGYRGSESDAVVYSDSSAAASAALLVASRTLGDDDLAREAIEQLERVLLASYRPGRGIAHCDDGSLRVPGLLADYVAMIHAILDAHEAAGSEPYAMMAEELAHFVVTNLWDEKLGACDDRAHETGEIGLLRERRTPFVANCDAVRAFARVARISGNGDFRIRADRAARAMAPHAVGYGPLAAHYVLAMRELTREVEPERG
jgi:uncharacterized protein YyaL (SSP411 family)